MGSRHTIYKRKEGGAWWPRYLVTTDQTHWIQWRVFVKCWSVTNGQSISITKGPLAGVDIKSKGVAGRSVIMKSPLGVRTLFRKLYSGHVPSPWPWPVLYKITLWPYKQAALSYGWAGLWSSFSKRLLDVLCCLCSRITTWWLLGDHWPDTLNSMKSVH